MTSFWENTFIETAARYSVAVLCIILFMAIFELVTSYKNWEEIRRGNLSVAMATGGKMFGIMNIFRYSFEHNNSLVESISWGVFGFILLLLGYFIFEFLTPTYKIDSEITNDNRAVGFISMVISVGLSFVIGGSIVG